MKIFIITTKVVIQRLEAIKDIDTNRLQDEIENAFDNYNVEGEEELTGQNSWCDYSKDGEYQLNIKIDHEDSVRAFDRYVKKRAKGKEDHNEQERLSIFFSGETSNFFCKSKKSNIKFKENP